MAELKPPRAHITFLEGKKKGEQVEVMFNPSEYGIEMSNKYSSTALPGMSAPVLQFVHGESQTLTMELLFDTYTNKKGEDVTVYTKRFAQSLLIDEELHAPPPVTVSWDALKFDAVVEKLSQKFTMFHDDGRPVRASLNVTFRQYQPIAKQLNNPKKQSADKTRAHELKGDESLWMLAARYYGEPRYWRKIAFANKIVYPIGVPAGTLLLLPPLDEADAP